ncbi:MAG: PAS domain S-box protein, partial [Candidatus Electrothrix sp. ATG1]|nr:PAS domain S-box protein [Candidatus Electrothrix sp. ATG1]
MPDIKKKKDSLTRERYQYLDKIQRLERRVLSLEEELGGVHRKAKRCRTVASLVRKLYGALHPQSTVDEIASTFLNLLSETLHIERAVLFTCLPEDNRFFVQYALGLQTTADSLYLDGEIRDFAFSNTENDSNQLLEELQNFLGLPFFLWSYKKEKKTALLLGNNVKDDPSYSFDKDDQEVIESILNVFMEIITRKQTEKELLLAAQVFSGSVEGTIITDADFRVLRVNRAFTQITGYEPDEVVGKKLFWLENEDFFQQVLLNLQNHDNWCGEYQDITKDGVAYVGWLNINSVKNIQGEATDYIFEFLDITKERSKEEENDRYLQELNAAYRRFVPQRFEYLEKPSIIDIELGNHVERSMTVLFSDLVDFTRLSESMTPTENFRFINSYLSIMEPIITRHNGFIDKYIGDAVMALFDGKADDAVRAAVGMLRILVSYNEGRSKAGYKPIDLSIGVNTGTLMLGTVGSPMRMEGTVVSDSVNLAARIEGVNKIYRT